MREYTKEDVEEFFKGVLERQAARHKFVLDGMTVIVDDMKKDPEKWFGETKVIEGNSDPTLGEYKP